MKRLMAVLSMVTVLALSVATAPVSAGTITYHGVTVTCVNTSDGAKYTVTFKGQTFTYTVVGAQCLI
jgi:hypothetical protein